MLNKSRLLGLAVAGFGHFAATRIVVVPFLLATPAMADCFDETLMVSRYHYPNPGNVAENYQDLYLLDFPSLPNTTPVVTRLSVGFDASPRYDSTDAVFSADGSRIVFVSNRDNAATDLYVMDPEDGDGDGEGDNLVRVTNDGFERFGLDWGDGDRLAYVSENMSYQTAIATLDVNGSLAGETQLTSHSGETAPPTLSIDGNHVVAVFEETPFPSRTHSLNHVSTSGGSITNLLHDGVVNQSPSLSPNGAKLYFASPRTGGQLDVFQASVDLSASPPTLGALTNLTQTPNFDESDVKVSPDGSCIAYLSSDMTSTYGPNSDLYIADLSGQITRRVTSTRDLGSFDWAPLGFSVASSEQPKRAFQQTVMPTGVRCAPFAANDVERVPINGVEANIHTLSIAPASPNLERCTTDIPPFTKCALTKIENAGPDRSCEVKPTRGIVNTGRWSLFAENASGHSDLVCSMTCFVE